jgi:DNA-binding MarR family transcriptional regulator
MPAKKPDVPALDPVVHGQLRLSVLAILSSLDEADFTYLRDRTGATDGNLSIHLGKLEDAGYLRSSKSFVARKPRTTYHMTSRGRGALVEYVKQLKAILGPGSLD